MTHTEHSRFPMNPLAVEHAQATFHTDTDTVSSGPLLGEAPDATNWESAWIDLGGEG